MTSLNPEQSIEARHERREVASRDFDDVRMPARVAGMRLVKRDESHYSLFWGPGQKWLLNIYPGNQRLYHDKNRRGPFVDMSGKGVDDPWTLGDVLAACIEKQSAVEA